MFAKPAPKKPITAGTKPKAQSKAKTVSVKTGVKAPQGKKTKCEVKKSLKPPPRPDAGYCLYSSDSEDQVSLALNDMEMCEKLLTQIKHNQQEVEKQQKHKGKKKKKDKSPLPKALNENPPRSDIVPGFSSIYGTTYPYGTALFLRQLQSQDYANNPIFNTRLTSSTPDPEKHLADLSANKLPSGTDCVSQDVPEKDVSAVSSVPPSFNHLQNMADMVDIYKRIEFNKYTELQEAAARAELEKFKAFQGASLKGSQSEAEYDGQGQGQYHFDSSGQNVKIPVDNTQHLSENMVGRPSDGFVGTGSLGFSLPGSDTVFRPVVPGSSLNPNSDMHAVDQQDSSLTAFQPYLNGDSKEVLPPQAWLPSNQPQSQVYAENLENSHLSSQNSTLKEGREVEIPLSGRTDYTEESKGTEYNTLVRQSDVEGNQARKNTDGKVVFEKQNGLFQLHLKKSSDQSSSGNDSKSDKSGSTTKGQGSLHEVPERDNPEHNSKAPLANSQSTKNGTYSVGVKNDSQNLSEMTSSTPRNTNTSGNGSTSSCGGRIVFIPDNSNTQNVIGYVPGLPMIPGANQPMSIPVTNETGNTVQSGSVLSSVVGQQGQQSVSQMTSQGGPNGSGYQSARHAQTIAAGDIGVRKLRYLLKELKECTKVSKDVEVTRLVTEIDTAVNAIPQLSMTFNLQTEIDLAIQPLRSENSQLRRKLRLVNQHLKEKELSANEEPKDVNFEILHLQTSNETLQNVLKGEKEIKTRLAAEVQYLYNEIHKMKVEKSKLIAGTSEKETEQLKVRQEMALEIQGLKHDLDLIKKDQESMGNKMEAVEKENHILQITLKQRDDEIARQADIVETMKESIADLLGELEQSRAGEKTWDHNNSYGLNRLVKIVEEEKAGFTKDQGVERKRVRTPERRTRTPERRAFDFNNSDSTTSTTRLTRAALAYHDQRHRPAVGRLGPDGRQGPASESELDTLVEMYSRNRPTIDGQGKIDRPSRRRTSSSSPVRLRNDPAGGNLRQKQSARSPSYGRNQARDAGGKIGKGVDKVGYYSRPRENTMGQDSDDNQDSSPSRRQALSKKQSPYRRVSRGAENLSPDKRTHLKGRGTMAIDGSEISVEQSRYSVTDYFKKYHPQDAAAVRPKEPVSGERNLPPSGPARRFNRDNVITGQLRRDNEIQERLGTQFRTSSEIDDRTVKSSDVQRNPRQNKFFRDDQTVSAINDDDNFSSVSMSSVTTANTVDDRKFRSGIATLDANIARLQQALQKTKSMLT